MISVETEWKKGSHVDSEEVKYIPLSKKAEYSHSAYRGPYLFLTLLKYGTVIKAVPSETKSEDSQFSASHFLLITKSAKELQKEIGEFIMCVPNLGLEIKVPQYDKASSDTDGEKIVHDAILNHVQKCMRLF